MASLSKKSALDVLKGRLKEKYTGRKFAFISPLPRSSVQLHVEDIFVEVLLRRKEDAVKLCRESGGKKALFLPLDEDGSSHPIFARKGE